MEVSKMQTVLDLQKLEVADPDYAAPGDSCTSSWSGCCNGTGNDNN
jgi:hypothetical protein